LSRVEKEGAQPLLSALFCGDRLVSVVYNVWYRGVVYNIQAGFDESFHKKIALGSLHLGYALESAFQDNKTFALDMLAGVGRREDYKARFATDAYQLISIMLVKSPILRTLYWAKGKGNLEGTT
jgi:hypothetical protein